MERPLRQQVELVLSLAKRDLKARYKESVFGFLWTLFRPAFMTLVLWVVFSKILQMPDPSPRVPYWLHVMVGLLAWNFFLGSLFDATNSVVANANLLKKVKLDTEVFPIATIVANAVHFLLALGVGLVVVLLAGVRPGVSIALLPLLIALEMLLLLGLSLYLSALNVFYRDVGSMLELLSMAWFYVTPIIYPVSLAAQQLDKKLGAAGIYAYLLNPIAPIIVAMRQVILFSGEKGELAPKTLAIALAASLVTSLVLVVTGWKLFRRLSDRFADEL